VKSLSPLAYVPCRASLQSAGLGPAALYLGAYLVICFLSSDPIVLVAATFGAALAGYGCHAQRAVRFSLRLGALLAVSMIVINGLVTSRGETVLLRLGEWPVFGRIDVTAESLAAGAVIGLRAMGTMVVIGVWSACIDPDRVLRAMHRTARRSALTATLISRLVPIAASDQARLSEAARLRGPGATPVGRVALAHRLLAGSLDRAVDVAATFDVDTYQRPGRLTLRNGATWPIALRDSNAIQIQYSAGYGGSGANVPAPLRRAVKQMVSHMYAHRGDGCDAGDAYADSGAAAIVGRYKVIKI